MRSRKKNGPASLAGAARVDLKRRAITGKSGKEYWPKRPDCLLDVVLVLLHLNRLEAATSGGPLAIGVRAQDLVEHPLWPAHKGVGEDTSDEKRDQIKRLLRSFRDWDSVLQKKVGHAVIVRTTHGGAATAFSVHTRFALAPDVTIEPSSAPECRALLQQMRESEPTDRSTPVADMGLSATELGTWGTAMSLARLALIRDRLTPNDKPDGDDGDGNDKSVVEVIDNLVTNELPRLPTQFYGLAKLVLFDALIAADQYDRLGQEIEDLQKRSDLSAYLRLRMRVAEAYVPLRRGQFPEAFELLDSVLSSPIFGQLGIADEGQVHQLYGRVVREDAHRRREAGALGASAFAERLQAALNCFMQALFLFSQSGRPDLVSTCQYYLGSTLLALDCIDGFGEKEREVTVRRWLRATHTLDKKLRGAQEHPTRTILRGRIEAEYRPEKWRDALSAFRDAREYGARTQHLRFVTLARHFEVEYLIRWHESPPTDSSQNEMARLARDAYAGFELDLKETPSSTVDKSNSRERFLRIYGSKLEGMGIDLAAVRREALHHMEK